MVAVNGAYAATSSTWLECEQHTIKASTTETRCAPTSTRADYVLTWQDSASTDHQYVIGNHSNNTSPLKSNHVSSTSLKKNAAQPASSALTLMRKLYPNRIVKQKRGIIYIKPPSLKCLFARYITLTVLEEPGGTLSEVASIIVSFLKG